MDNWTQVKLGEDPCFVRKDGDGIAQAIRGEVSLYESLKDMYPAGEGSSRITSQGYYKCNRISGLSILNPDKLMLGSTVTSNPHVEFSDSKSRSISFVAVRKIVFGPGGNGSLTAVDKTMFFVVQAYLIPDLQAKISVEGCGGLGTAIRKPQVFDKIGSMVSFPIEGTPIHIWVDFAHAEIQQVMRDHTQRIKFAERIATSIVERNCFKAHPAIGVHTVPSKGGHAIVPVFGYKMDMTYPELRNKLRAIEAGEMPDDIEVIASTGADADLDEVLEETSVSGDEHGVNSPDQEDTPEATEVKKDPEWEAVLEAIAKMKFKMIPQLYFQVLSEHEVIDLYKLKTTQLKELLDVLKKEHKESQNY